MAVVLNAQGWTDITASADSRIVYVSSTGSDANSGLSSALPKATIAAGYALLRTGYPDQLLLKKGDSWSESLSWGKSGRSAQEPILLGAYGTGARPSIRPTSGNHGNLTYSSTAINYVAFIGVEFYARTRDPGVGGYDGSTATIGILYTTPGNGFLLEDCAIKFFGTNLSFGGRGPGAQGLTNVVIRRNVIVDAYSLSGHSQGILAGETDGITIIENILDHNGWNDTAGAVKTIFNQTIYLHESNLSENILIRGNIITRGSSHGVQFRRGGTARENLVVDCAIGIQPGGGDTPIAGGVVGDVIDNVILESGDIGAAPRGTGIILKSNVRDTVVSGNLISDDQSAALYGNGIQVESGVVRTALNDNIIWDWANPTDIQAGASITTSGNYYGSRGGANTPGYSAPTRNLAGYSLSLSLAETNAAFLTAARGQSRDAWDADLTAAAANEWIRDGFDIAAAGETTAPTGTLSATNVTTTASAYNFTVTYADASGISVTSLGNGNIRCTGPNGYDAAAEFISIDVAGNGTPRTATYRITPPGGTWNATDNGTYTLTLLGGQVTDTLGNAISLSTLGTFTVTIPLSSTPPVVAARRSGMTLTEARSILIDSVLHVSPNTYDTIKQDRALKFALGRFVRNTGCSRDTITVDIADATRTVDIDAAIAASDPAVLPLGVPNIVSARIGYEPVQVVNFPHAMRLIRNDATAEGRPQYLSFESMAALAHLYPLPDADYSLTLNYKADLVQWDSGTTESDDVILNVPDDYIYDVIWLGGGPALVYGEPASNWANGGWAQFEALIQQARGDITVTPGVYIRSSPL